MAEVLRVPVFADDARWNQVAPVLDQAMKRAFAGKRHVEWLRSKPSESLRATQETGLYLAAHDGPLELLRGCLGLSRREVTFGATRLVHPLQATETIEGTTAATFLSVLRRRAPHLVRPLRFATRERVEAHLRAIGQRETPVVDAAVSLEPHSLGGFVAALVPALEQAPERGETRALLVHHEAPWGALESAVEFQAFQIVPNTLGERALTAWAVERVRSIEGDDVAAELREEARRTKAVLLDYATVETLLPRLLKKEEGATTYVATARAAGTLEPVLAHLAGEAGTAVSLNRDGTRAGFEASETEEGLRLAAASLFDHVGWAEAAKRVRAA